MNRLHKLLREERGYSLIEHRAWKYYEFVYNGDDFKARVAKSKFRTMPGFAKSDSGYLCLQGDHGSVSFRNIKLRPHTPAATGAAAIQ